MSAPPQITDHAFDRARDRMGLSDAAFWGWVRATYRSWVPINAAYLRERGLKVSSEGSTHLMCPWLPSWSVALCVSNDNWIKTLMLFREDFREPVLVDDADPLYQAAQRLVNEIEPRDILKRLLNIHVAGHLAEEAVVAFVRGRLSRDEFYRFFQMGDKNREKMLGKQIRPVVLSEAERQLISRQGTSP